MVTRVRIERWCDVCQEEMPGEEREVALDGRRPLYVDLCAEHEEQLLGPLREILSTHGSPTRTTQPVLGYRQPARAPSKSHPCILCSSSFSGAGDLGRHYADVHGYARTGKHGTSLATVYGKVCPLCGQEQGSRAHMRSHRAELGDDPTNTATLFARADELGDPHGVVAKVRANAPKG